MALKPLSIAAVAAAGLLALTFAVAISQRGEEYDPLRPRRIVRSVEATPETSGRCAIFHARFGGTRAELVRVVRAGVANYVVLEVGRRDPLIQRQRGIWLRGTYGDGEQAWLGTFSSPDAAMRRAATLCPPSLRCWPGDTDCGSREQLLTPARAFLQL